MKTGSHRIDLLRGPRSIRVVCTCGWKFRETSANGRPSALGADAHRAMREHLGLRDQRTGNAA